MTERRYLSADDIKALPPHTKLVVDVETYSFDQHWTKRPQTEVVLDDVAVVVPSTDFANIELRVLAIMASNEEAFIKYLFGPYEGTFVSPYGTAYAHCDPAPQKHRVHQASFLKQEAIKAYLTNMTERGWNMIINDEFLSVDPVQPEPTKHHRESYLKHSGHFKKGRNRRA